MSSVAIAPGRSLHDGFIVSFAQSPIAIRICGMVYGRNDGPIGLVRLGTIG